MNVRQLKTEWEAGRVRLIDVRTPAEFEELSIEGAVLMPMDRLKVEEVRALPGMRVLVCRSGRRAEQVRQKLVDAGVDEVEVLEGGVEAWEAAGYQVKRGKSVMSLERQVRVVAGSLVLLGVLLGMTVHPGFYGLSAFVGGGLVFAGLTDWCGMAMLLARAPWNQGDRSGEK